MATRYSKRQFDGTVDYYESREEMEAANPEMSAGQLISDLSRSYNPFFAILGFVIVGIVAVLVLAISNDFSGLATWVKFGIALGIATVAGYIFGKFGNVIFMLMIVLFGLGIAGRIVVLVWRLLS